MIAVLPYKKIRIAPEQVFLISAFVVNAGNYVYNLLLGRILGPSDFADAVILITLLLVLSFIAMTFQLTVTKFIAQISTGQQQAFISKMYVYAVGFGVLLGAFIVLMAPWLQAVFQTESVLMFRIFGLAIPLYFVMSINRGLLQGQQSFVKLSWTYQLEMLFRLSLTFVFLIFFQLDAAISVSIAIGISFIAGIFPVRSVKLSRWFSGFTDGTTSPLVLPFFVLTACYELTQIICNNSDILLVKSYFDSYQAGLYASLALIGRVVYFVTWMFVMLLLPKVIELHKNGKDASSVLKKYTAYIVGLSAVIVSFSFLFPNFTVRLLFGEQYLSIAPLLGWYALATSFFAISNLFAYYFLSLDQYRPVVISGVFGIVQVIAIVFFHDSLFEVVIAQVLVMGALLVLQLGYYKWQNQRAPKSLIER